MAGIGVSKAGSWPVLQDGDLAGGVMAGPVNLQLHLPGACLRE